MRASVRYGEQLPQAVLKVVVKPDGLKLCWDVGHDEQTRQQYLEAADLGL